jgi:hypothetical protein
MGKIKADERRLAELILYISKKSAHDPRFGAVKLNKILYFSDFLAFGTWGKSITDAEYQHLPNGPAPRRLLPLRRELISQGDLALQSVGLLRGKVQLRTVNLREPNLTLFDGREISLVDGVIDELSGMTADDTSELSHRYIGWKATSEGETIPYKSVFVSDEPLSRAETRRAQELEKERPAGKAA